MDQDKNIVSDNRIVRIEEIQPNKYNPKLPFDKTPEGKKQFARIKKSLQVHKQIEPIIVREVEGGHFEIINGYHRYMAAQELGWPFLEIKNLGKISLNNAKIKALATEDAKVALDKIETAKLVKDILGFDPDSIGELPYDQEDLDAQIKLLDFDWGGFEEDGSGEDEDLTNENHDDSEGYKIVLPNAKLKEWRELKTIKGCQSDTELIVTMIDENMLVYGEETTSTETRRKAKKA